MAVNKNVLFVYIFAFALHGLQTDEEATTASKRNINKYVCPKTSKTQNE